MISLRAVVLVLSFILGFACAAPGGWGSSHKHVRIIVPSHHHTVHHHHVEKVHVPVHIPVPVVKKVFIPVETHHHEPIIAHHEPIIAHHEPIIAHHEPIISHHDDWQGAGWW